MACTFVKKGALAMTEQPKKKSYSVKNGWVTTRSWEGPSEYADSLVASLVNGSAETVNVNELAGGVTSVVATFSDATGGGTVSNQQNETWSFSETILQKGLHNMPYFNTSQALATCVSIAKHDIDEVGTDPADVDVTTITGYGALSAGEQTALAAYVSFRKKGVVDYEEHMPTITLTKSQSRRATVKHSLENCNKKVAYADIGLPGDVPWEEPKYQNLSGTPTAYEWLKTYPNVEFDGMRSTISQSWVGFWKLSSIMYGGTDTP